MNLLRPLPAFAEITILSFLSLGLVPLLPPDAAIARPEIFTDRAPPPDEEGGPRKSGMAVSDVQRALSEMGYYVGAIDGQLNRETRAAIRIYQKQVGLKIDGKVTRPLWSALQNTSKVQILLRHLEQARKSGIEKARDALLANPATRDLIKPAGPEKADPTRDASACFADPSVSCLLNAALANVKAVFKPELRDWALGEILAAQSRAGMNEAARQTAAQMQDPRLIMVALRDIAEGQAESGNADGAWEAVNIIPDTTKMVEALVAIATIQTRQRRFDDAEKTIFRLDRLLDQEKSHTRQVSLGSQVAILLARAGKPTLSSSRLTRLETMARALSSDPDKEISLRYVAAALAETGHPDKAMVILESISSASERTSVLISTAAAQAQAGNTSAALATAETIEAVRYRAVLLCKIAISQATGNEFEAAWQTLDRARRSIEQISLPFARSYAISRISLSISQLVVMAGNKRENSGEPGSQAGSLQFSDAVKLAQSIDDARLRAHTLWSIGSDQRQSGDADGASATEQEAQLATVDIKSQLTQVWMYTELAILFAGRRDSDSSQRSFKSALDTASQIDNAWGRARALAKLAGTMLEMASIGAPPH